MNVNQTLANLLAGARNGHISIPLVIAIALEIIPIFAPQCASKLQEVQKVLLAYGIIAAANSGPSQANPPQPGTLASTVTPTTPK